MNKTTLTIYPSRAALCQTQRKSLDKSFFFDNRFHITLSNFLRTCAQSAQKAGLLNQGNGSPLIVINDFYLELAIHECIRKIEEVDAMIPPLRQLSRSAKRETLRQLIAMISPLADRISEFLAILKNNGEQSTELANAYQLFTKTCAEMGIADKGTINAAILKLLRGDSRHWPDCLKNAAQISFEGIVWTGPFLEMVVQKLSKKKNLFQITSKKMLYNYEIESLGIKTIVAGLIEQVWAEPDSNPQSDDLYSHAREAMISLRDGWKMKDPNLAKTARNHVAFSCSAGTYGEVEDIARRIAWILRQKDQNHKPEDICVVARNIGDYADAIADVFARFNIPHYFRRGTPVLSAPIIRTILSLIDLSANANRDLFCNLLNNPWLDCQSLFGSKNLSGMRAAEIIIKSGVETVIESDDALRRRIDSYTAEKHLSPDIAQHILTAWRKVSGCRECRTIDDGLRDLLKRCESELKISQTINSIAGAIGSSALERHAHLLNAKAYDQFLKTAHAALDMPILFKRSAAWPDISSFLIQLMQNAAVASADADESGVWIINPHDIGGMSFKTVILLGMNAGVFPSVPSPNPLLSDAELLTVRKEMNARALLPQTALGTSREQHAQDNILFLSGIAAAREQIVFSYAGHDENGRRRQASVYFDSLWRMAGWPAHGKKMEPLRPDSYDAWRLAQCGANSHFGQHWIKIAGDYRGGKEKESTIKPHRREPFPGESYLAILPSRLCLTADEARQSAACLANKQQTETEHQPAAKVPRQNESIQGGNATAENIVSAIHIENVRASFIRKMEDIVKLPTASHGAAYSAEAMLLGLLRRSKAPGPTPPEQSSWLRRLDCEGWTAKAGSLRNPAKPRPFIPVAPARPPRRTIRRGEIAGGSHRVLPTPPEQSSWLRRLDWRRRVEDDSSPADPDLNIPGGEYSGIIKSEVWTELRKGLHDKIYNLSVSQLGKFVSCPFSFYLAHILGIHDIKANEIDASPRDVGSLIHITMHLGMSIMRGEKLPETAPPSVKSLKKKYASSFKPAWAVKNGDIWRLVHTPPSADQSSIALCRIDAGRHDSALKLFLDIAQCLFDSCEQGGNTLKLGSPKLLKAKWREIERCLINLTTAVFSDSSYEYKDKPFLDEAQRYNAFTEHEFTGLKLTDIDNHLFHGEIDRVDMFFDKDTNRITGMSIIDYKSKSEKSPLTLARDIIAGSDCQLALYALAVKNIFLPADANIPVIFQYLAYNSGRKKIEESAKNKWLSLGTLPISQNMLDELGISNGVDLIKNMIARISEYLALLEQGKFIFKPDKDTCKHCDFKRCCRYYASSEGN